MFRVMSSVKIVFFFILSLRKYMEHRYKQLQTCWLLRAVLGAGSYFFLGGGEVSDNLFVTCNFVLNFMYEQR